MDSKQVESYARQALAALDLVKDKAGLSEWHKQHLSRAGELTALKKGIGQVAPEQRKAFGQNVNQVAAQLTQAFSARTESIKLAEIAERIAEEYIDVTLPAREVQQGAYHPCTLIMREIQSIFASMGFSVLESPHVELDEMSFQLLNIPKHHPARDMQDTFFISEDVVMRPHTSPGQIHAMRRFAPNPVQVILPGLCYRNEDITPRSEIQFYQVEGLLVGESVRFSDLKGIISRFARHMFGEDQQIRFRGSYFPFTEPSVEVDMLCTFCHGRGEVEPGKACRICKHTGWLELLGSGLVHPVVLENGGYDPDKVQGIAFGMGPMRMLMLRHRIEDIRYLFQNDLRFLRQFI